MSGGDELIIAESNYHVLVTYVYYLLVSYY